MSYYNTTNINGKFLSDAVKKAKSQNDKILNFMLENPNKKYTPEHVHDLLFSENVPLTSVRRSFSVLQGKGMITKTKEKVLGKYGRPVYVWVLSAEALIKKSYGLD
jgi:predicted transcriptional regulator